MTIENITEGLAKLGKLAGIVDRVVDAVAPHLVEKPSRPREPRVGDAVIYHDEDGTHRPATVLAVPGGATVHLAVLMRRNGVSAECIHVFRSCLLAPAAVAGGWTYR